MSDTVWLAIIGVFAMAVKEYFDQRRADKLAAKAAEAVVKVESVKTVLEQNTASQKEVDATRDGKIDGILKTGNEVKKLVNHQYGVSLRLGAETARWKYNSERTEENLRAAELAERLWREHDARQKEIDNQAEKG